MTYIRSIRDGTRFIPFSLQVISILDSDRLYMPGLDINISIDMMHGSPLLGNSRNRCTETRKLFASKRSPFLNHNHIHSNKLLFALQIRPIRL